VAKVSHLAEDLLAKRESGRKDAGRAAPRAPDSERSALAAALLGKKKKKD
jgi:hypothetical protein